MGFLEWEENLEIFVNTHQKASIAEKVDKMTYLLNVSLHLFLATPIFAQGTNFKSGHGNMVTKMEVYLELNNMNFA